MAILKSNQAFQRLDELELTVCSFFNHIGDRRSIERFFTVISRLGNGVFWYFLMAIIPFVDTINGYIVSIHMAVVALVCLLIYKVLKNNLVRERPFIKWDTIRNGTAPLDLYSFPSGHTLHAVAFTIVAVTYYPMLGILLIPFTVLIALSRVILGLHYPTDVLVGTVIGACIAAGSFYLPI